MTTSYGHARLGRILDRGGLLLSVFGGIATLIICASLSSFYFGYEAGRKLPPNSAINATGTSYSSPLMSSYEYMGTIYERLAIWLAVYCFYVMVCNALLASPKLRFISKLLALTPLLLSFYEISWIFAEKKLRSQTIYWLSDNDNLLRETIYIDWVVFSLVLVMFLVQISTSVMDFSLTGSKKFLLR